MTSMTANQVAVAYTLTGVVGVVTARSHANSQRHGGCRRTSNPSNHIGANVLLKIVSCNITQCIFVCVRVCVVRCHTDARTVT